MQQEEKMSSRTRRGTNRVTMDDVAARAEVSASSVSLFLRNPDAVSARIAPRIRRAIDELGYVPNQLAGSLAAARTRAVGVIVPSLRNAFFSETVTALQQQLDARGYQLLLGATDYDPERETELVRAFLSWSPTAIVVTGCTHREATRKLLRGAQAPVVEMWEIGERPFDLQVGFSHRTVGEALAEHLYGIGRRKVAFVGGRMTQDSRARQRAAGFQAWFAARGIEARIVDSPGEATPARGGDALRQLIDVMPDVDAVACSNDVMALGMLFEAQRLGLAVPDRLAVTGFGDLPFSQVCVPPLTTVQPHARSIGLRIADELLAMVKAPDEQASDSKRARRADARTVDVGFDLVVRASSARSA
jgi:LacI family transcriptional regulator, gluconate utilization system Gnt-I transcriptional repressor